VKLGFLFLFMISSALAQTRVQGRVTDAGGKGPVPFASIGIIGKPVGTVGDNDGNFDFTFGSDLIRDSLRISAIGYKPQTFPVREFIKTSAHLISLEPQATALEEVVIKSRKIKFTRLGNTAYSKNNCSGFVKNSNNWKGSEAAILAGNKTGRLVRLETFSFYIIQNKYDDSLAFRLMFYEASEKQYPRLKTFVKKPIIFKVGLKQGEFVLDLKDYNLYTSKDFFISLECLMDEMDITKFCYAGSYATPSFVKSAAFERWTKVKGGGADFNVKVSYSKE
jgi:hypothetical protein